MIGVRRLVDAPRSRPCQSPPTEGNVQHCDCIGAMGGRVVIEISGQEEVQILAVSSLGNGSPIAYFDHLKRVNDLFYDQVKISDQKAAYIFTFMLAFLVSSTEGREVFTLDRYVHGMTLNALASAFLGLSSAISIFCAVKVVLPRHINKTSSLFWGTWPQQRDVFRQAAISGDSDYLFEQYMINADVLAQIARDKYRYTTYAFRSLLLTVLAYVILLVAV